MRQTRTEAWKAGALMGLGLCLGACEGQKFAYDGETLWERFPLEGERLWEYVNEDPNAAEYALVVEKTGEVLQNGKNITTLSYTARDSDGGEVLLHEIDWSTDSDDGIEIWRWVDFTEDSAGVTVEYSPPIQAAARQMNSGDLVETETGGGTYSGEYSGLQDCPNNWSTDVWECARLTISSDIGGEPFTGEYWIAMSYGTSWMAPAEVGGKWVLANANFGAGSE